MKNKKINIYDLQTNIFLEFARAVKLGFTNLWRNKALTLATIFVIAVMVCIFNSILAVNSITNQALKSLNEKVDIVIYLQDNISFYDARSLSEELSKLQGVQKTEYISKEDALKIISKTYPETAEFLIKFNIKNPLPPSINLKTNNAEDYQTILDYIQNSRYKDYLQDSTTNLNRNDNDILRSVANNLVNINRFVKQLIFWIVLTFIIGGTLIIVNAIQLTIYTRRNEIYIMRLVGATPSFIRLPFMVEGIFYGVFAIILSFAMILIVGKLLNLGELSVFANFTPTDFLKVFLFELLLSVLLGAISSYSSVQKHLKSKLSLS